MVRPWPHGVLCWDRTYLHVLKHVNSLSVVDTGAATAVVGILLALCVAEVLIGLYLLAIAAGELETRS